MAENVDCVKDSYASKEVIYVVEIYAWCEDGGGGM